MDQPDHRLDRLLPEVTENIAEWLQFENDNGEGLTGFRSLRLACKDLYLKTFRVFALAYFTDLSVAFNIASLHRLRDIANHRNCFGLSLRTFPVSLDCSTYRIPIGDAVRSALMITEDPARSVIADYIVATITRACKKQGLFGSFHRPYLQPSKRDIARQYMKAAEQQGSIESTGHDIKLLAEALAALPNMRSLSSSGDRKAWGQPNWEQLAGIKMESFLFTEYLASGETNLTIATRKLLSAIAQASVICRKEGGQLLIEQVDLDGEHGRNASSPCPNNIQLHKLDLADIRVPLRDAFSHLKRLYISVCGITTFGPGTPAELQKSRSTLEVLLCAQSTEEFCLDCFERTHPMGLSGLVSTDGHLIESAMEVQKFSGLRSIEIYSAALFLAKPALAQFIRTHAATLKELHIETARGEQLGAEEAREAWKEVLQAASSCSKLDGLIVTLHADAPGLYDIDISLNGTKAVADLLAKLVAGPTEPGKELGWVR